MNKIKILSNFNSEIFSNYLNQKLNNREHKITKPVFGSFYQQSFKLIRSKEKIGTIIVWNQIEKILVNFDKLIYNKKFNYNELLKENKDYIKILKQLSKKCNQLIVFGWQKPNLYQGKSIKDFTDKLGVLKNVTKLNLQISDSIQDIENIFFFPPELYFNNATEEYSPKLWYAAKIPYSQNTFKSASEKINELFNNLKSKKVKLIILDLDNTLWGGEVGDIGWQKVKIGGHSIEGEAYVDFQRIIKGLKDTGIQLAICSKNDEKIALDAITKNKNMVLKKSDFVIWKINWEDKAKNIREIIKKLNFTNESVLFIDDNVNERDRVKTAITGIKVPDWPSDPTEYPSEILKLNCFETYKKITKEDKKRLGYYKDDLKRKKTKSDFVSELNWLKNLKTNILCKKITKENEDRIVQLINRTNQMNLRTRRYNQEKLQEIQKDKKSFLRCFHLKDKFGDMGIVGFFNLTRHKNKLIIDDFILSCRAFGRGVEKTMLHIISNYAVQKKIKLAEFNFKKTDKNKPCLTFLKENLKELKKNRFIIKDIKKSVKPNYLKLIKE